MQTKRPSKQQLNNLEQICRQAGIKMTHQRLEIFREILAAGDHPSAEELHKRLQKTLPTIAIDTVYRTLSTFNELGIIKKLHILNEKTLFDPNMAQHHHFICTRCKAVEDIYWPEFDNSELPAIVQKKGTVESRHLELHGICDKCRDKTTP